MRNKVVEANTAASLERRKLLAIDLDAMFELLAQPLDLLAQSRSARSIDREREIVLEIAIFAGRVARFVHVRISLLRARLVVGDRFEQGWVRKGWSGQLSFS